MTVLADFETESVATAIGAVQNVRAADCVLKQSRGLAYNSQWRLETIIGATAPNATVECNFQFRADSRFENLDRIAVWCWLQSGEIEVTYRLRDRNGRLFETRGVAHRAYPSWQRLVVDAGQAALLAIGDAAAQTAGPAEAPLEFASLKIVSRQVGRQEIFFDNLEVEHRVATQEMIRGEYVFDEPTQLYPPGALVSTYLNLENISRSEQLRLSVELEWLRSDGRALATQRGAMTLPPSGDRFRSYQRVDFSQKIADAGLYRLVARVRGQNWPAPATFETSIAVTPSNRNLPRGRSTFFGVRTNLLREPRVDQELEIRVAREIGAQLLALDAPWEQLERSQDRYDFSALAPVVKSVAERDMALLLALTQPPDWLPGDAAARLERQGLLIERLVAEFGQQANRVQPLWGDAAALGPLQARVREKDASAAVFGALSLAAKDLVSQLKSLREAGVLTIVASDGELAPVEARWAELTGANSNISEKVVHWQHSLAPLAGAGGISDAVKVLRHCVQAARSDAGGVIWLDLRDDDNDARQPEKLTGLVRRDFSPKTPLLGLATATGMLSGLIYAGPLRGADEATFESAVFIGGARQVALLIPRPHRPRPALLAPLGGVPGALALVDFERRAQALTPTGAPLLIPCPDAPIFLTLDATQAQAAAEILLAEPWLRMPAQVLVGQTGQFAIELTLPRAVKRGYLRVAPPAGAAVRSKFEAKALKGEAGEIVRVDVELERVSQDDFQPLTLAVSLALDQSTFEFPVTVRGALAAPRATTGANLVDQRYRCAVLRSPAADAKSSPTAPLHVAYEPGRLVLALPLIPALGSTPRVDLGVAMEGQEAIAEATILPVESKATIERRRGTPAEALRGWRAEVISAADGGRWLRLEVSARALGVEKLAAGEHCLLGMSVSSPAMAEPLGWGTISDDEPSSRGYGWIRLSAE